MGKRKLKRVDARDIRISLRTRPELAERYGVSVSTIRQIQRGLKWKNAGGPIHEPQPTGVLWAPSDRDFENVIAGLEIRGVWRDGAAAVGVAPATLQSFGGRSPGHGKAMAEAIAQGLAIVEAQDRADLFRVIDARRSVKSWGAAAAAAALSSSAVAGLRAKFPDTETECAEASASGRAHHDRNLLELAAALVGELGTWNRVATALGVSSGHLQAVRKRHPDLNEKLRAARRVVVGWQSIGTLYVIQDGHGMIKVGRTSNLPGRINGLIGANSSGVLDILLASEVENVGEVEARVHARLAKFRTHGEWFKTTARKAVSAAEAEIQASKREVQAQFL